MYSAIYPNKKWKYIEASSYGQVLLDTLPFIIASMAVEAIVSLQKLDWVACGIYFSFPVALAMVYLWKVVSLSRMYLE